MGQIINGRKIGKTIRRELAQAIEQQQLDPGLAAILVGDDPASHTYVKLKAHAAEQIGVRFTTHALIADTTTETLVALIQELNSDPTTHGILVQLPLPEHIDTGAVIAAIQPNKDVDGFQVNSPAQPVMAQVVETLITSTQELLEGKRTLIVANTPDVFAPPIAQALSEHGLVCASTTPDDPDTATELKESDVVVIAIGRPHWLKPSMIKDGAILIDIGITKVDDTIVGDVDPECDTVADWRTRVPGGVGPVTVAVLFRNLLELYKLQD